MYRDVIYSIVGHAIIFGGLFIPSFLDFQEKTPMTVYTVKTVSPQAIQQLIAKSAPEGQPKPKIPQVKIKPERTLPNKRWRPKQVAKQSTKKTADKATEQKSSKKPDKPPVQGMSVDGEFEYPDYLLDIRNRIERNWRPPTLRTELKTRVFFRVNKDGSIKRTYAEIKTGNMTFDLSAMNAVIKSGPFPPLPDDFEGEDVGIHMDFIFQQ